MTEKICIEISIGELIDKLTMTEVKRVLTSNIDEVSIIKKDLSILSMFAISYLNIPEIEKLHDKIMIVNKDLWNIEDFLRKSEDVKIFDHEFIMTCRRICVLNDLKADMRNEINVTISKVLKESQN